MAIIYYSLSRLLELTGLSYIDLAHSLSYSCSQTMAGAGEISKPSSFTCLAVDVNCWLETQLGISAGTLTLASPCVVGFLITWWMGSKKKYRERERAHASMSQVEAILIL